MRGKKAKTIRKEIYGDHAIRGRRTYQARDFIMFRGVREPRGALRCTGLRAEYQARKKVAR